MKSLIVAAASFGGILLFLLASASANTALFASHYPWLLGLNAIVALSLLALIAWQLHVLWREHRAQVFGSRLKLRLMLMFGLMAVLPGVLIYAVSVQFVTKSIETWFDVRVEKALEAGLNLGRSALDSLLEDLTAKGQIMALELAERSEAQRRLDLNRLREQHGVQSAALFSTSGELLATATGDLATLLPSQPGDEQLLLARKERRYAVIEGSGEKDLKLRVLIAVMPAGLGVETRLLQLIDPVPGALAVNADRVQTVYADYQELSLGREGLTRIYAMNLTLTVLLALFTGIALGFVLARAPVGAAVDPRRGYPGRGCWRLHAAPGSLQPRRTGYPDPIVQADDQPTRRGAPRQRTPSERTGGCACLPRIDPRQPFCRRPCFRPASGAANRQSGRAEHPG